MRRWSRLGGGGGTEEVVVDGKLGDGGRGHATDHLVGGEDVGGVVEEVADGDDAGLGDHAELVVGEVALGREADVVLGGPPLVLEQFEPLGFLFPLVVEEYSLQILHHSIFIPTMMSFTI